jgi:hypothetical protein
MDISGFSVDKAGIEEHLEFVKDRQNVVTIECQKKNRFRGEFDHLSFSDKEMTPAVQHGLLYIYLLIFSEEKNFSFLSRIFCRENSSWSASNRDKKDRDTNRGNGLKDQYMRSSAK